MFDPTKPAEALPGGFYRDLDISLYPETFTERPYVDDTFNTTHCNDRTIWSIDIDTPPSEAFSQKVTFYYYEGGYVTDADRVNVYQLVPNLKVPKLDAEGNPVVENGELVYYDDGLYGRAGLIISKEPSGYKEEKTYAEIIAGWSTYLEYYLADGTQVKDSYYTKNGNWYTKNINYMIKTGMLHRLVYKSHGAGEDVNYNYNKYLSTADYQLYTRYKYMKFGSNLQVSDLEDGWMDSKYVINDHVGVYKYEATGYLLIPPPNSIKRNPNGGRTTYFTESVKVTLGGGKTLDKLARSPSKGSVVLPTTTSGNIIVV